MIQQSLFDIICVTATADGECGAACERQRMMSEAQQWQQRHYEQTGHTRYLRMTSDYEVLNAPPAPSRTGQPVGVRPQLRSVPNAPPEYGVQ